MVSDLLILILSVSTHILLLTRTGLLLEFTTECGSETVQVYGLANALW